MIYKITLSSEEGVNFRLTLEADSEATFLELHKAIIQAVHYKDDQMTSFFMCNDSWEKEQEVTLVEMGKSFEYDNMVMESTRLSELMEEQGQRLIYIFDPMFERYFFGKLQEITAGTMEGVKCVEVRGTAPEQLRTNDPADGIVSKNGKADWETGEDFYGDTQYEADELDMEGFQDVSFEDGTL